MPKNFVGAYYNSFSEEVLVWERDGLNRILKRYDAPYYFYTQDEDGQFTSITGEKLRKHEFVSKEAFDNGLKQYSTRKKYESDLNPAEKILMQHYYNIDAPQLNYTLLDIEVDYDRDKGFSSPENPYAPINAITLFHQWKKEYVTFAVPPPTWDGKDWSKELDSTLPSKVTLFKTEAELLKAVLFNIEDSDVISGWNSDFFDMPYLVKRTEMVLGKETAKRWCYKGCPGPRWEEVERFNEKRITVRLSGRVHLDFLQLFKKFAFGGRSSYALKNIADEELEDFEKLVYEGSLDDLYRDDFNFFLRYNIRDTEILDRLDAKFKYLDLANEMTHANTITLDGAMGSVRLIDTGIVNYIHNVLNRIVNDRNNRIGPTIEGALVLNPMVGLSEWIGSVDINSLYPSTMRSLNASPEKIIGQFKDSDSQMRIDGEHHWQGISDQDDLPHTLYFDDPSLEPVTCTGKEWYAILKKKKWAVSGFGTVFDQGNGVGVIPGLLAVWYAERKQLQAQKVLWGNKADEYEKGSSEYQECKRKEEYYDKKQMVKKLLLNSLYGAVINQYDRFFDPRLGASTTATGRKITGHMISQIASLLTGDYAKLNKAKIYHDAKDEGPKSKSGLLEWDSENETEASDSTEDDDEVIDDHGQFSAVYTCNNKAIIYSDTDSCYFKTFAESKDEAILIADTVGDQVNESFIPFMQEKFLCQPTYDTLIKAGREVVADRGIFQAKKKYVLRVVNLDGKDVKPGDKKSFKAMGSEIKKSDTPKVIQKFLKEVTLRILDGATYEQIETYVNEERLKFKTQTNLLDIGVSRSVNKVEMYYEQYQFHQENPRTKKPRLPGHVRATINFNEYLKFAKDKGSAPIKSGNKIKVFYLKNNDMGFTSIAVPGELDNLPFWFKRDFNVDIKKTEQKLIDLKLESIFNPMKWQVPTPQTARNNKLLVWD